MVMRPAGTEKIEDSFEISGRRCLQLDGRWYQLQKVSVPKIAFSGTASNALGPVTISPAHSESDEDGNYETLQGRPKGSRIMSFF